MVIIWLDFNMSTLGNVYCVFFESLMWNINSKWYNLHELPTFKGDDMRNLVVASFVVILSFGTLIAADKPAKEVTLKGEINCTKCALSETADCGHAIKVSENGKDVIYYFKDKGKAESYHEMVCNGPAKGSVKGVLLEKDGKKWIVPVKDGVKYD